MDLSIIIVNYRSKAFTLNCLKSLAEADWNGLDKEIIVVDNNSEDNSAEIIRWQFPEIKLIESPINLGMGAGNNLGFKNSSGRYLVVMNPDTIAFKDVFQKLVVFMDENPRVGIVGPKQYNPDHSVQDSCYRWHGPLTPLYRRTGLGKTGFGQKDVSRFMMTDFNKNEPLDVDWLLGSFLMIRREALEEVGGFDERFFLYFEDTDICRRFHAKGWRVVYYPEAEIIHNHNRASAKTKWYRFFNSKSARMHIISWLKYIFKWRHL
ncbi:MAG: glycosyltransferase family 2 protein [Patescibacteria group bacterium]|nr:glycosyltransferase family 2 protein [Patescibacteria group bacterium]